MKFFRSLKTLVAAVGLLCGVASVRADVSYLVGIDTSSVVNNAGGPFYLDFLSLFGNGAAQTATVSNVSFTGGSAFGPAVLDGAVAGSLGTSLVFSPSNASFYNEFYQQFDATVSSISFNLDLTSNAAGDQPTGFSIALLNSDLLNIETNGIGNTLALFDLDSTVSFTTGTSTGSASGVTITLTPIPEPSTYALVVGVAALGVCIIRRRAVRNV